jgi:hypothetical protein
MTDLHVPTREAANLAARFAVSDLIHTYAQRVRRDEPDCAAALFLPDGVFEMRDGEPDCAEYSVRVRLEGADAINAHLSAGKGRAHPVPLIHNLIVAVDADTAHANCVMEGQIFATGQKVVGEYHDILRRVDGRWYFSSRVFTMYPASGV